MAGLAAAPEAGRAGVHDRLLRRNRIVAVLRWIVPAAGAVVLLAVLAAIVVDNLANQFGFSSLRIDRNNLVVDTPELSSTLADGTVLALSAEAARVAVDATDRVTLAGVSFSITPPAATALTAEADEAELQTTDQLITVVGTTRFSGTNGMSGTVVGMFADLFRQRVDASGAVAVDFGTGGHLAATGMSYDRRAGTWVFNRVTLTLPETPGDLP